MVQSKNGAGALHLITFFFLLCFLILLSSTTGLTLELIHRNSKRSPFYSANLTDIERYEMLNKISYERLQRFESSSSSSLDEVNLTAIRPPLRQISSSYLVAMKIGTAPGMNNDQFLLLDTGSGLTWTQCKPCNPCFDQTTEIFQPRLSPTYSRLACDDPLCKGQDYECKNNVCTYAMHYADGDFVNGVFSRERFGFQATPGAQNLEYIENLPFGCTDKSRTSFHDGVSSGILGMNGDPESFALQVANGSFSYCLSTQAHSGYLRFGNDIPRARRGPLLLQETPLVMPRGIRDYFLTLLDISVGNQRLNLDPRIFKRVETKGGVIIDSGSIKSYLVKTAYKKAEAVLMAYFKRYKLKMTKMPYDTTCFKVPRGVEVESFFPSMTFHLQGAKLEVEGRHMFEIFPDHKTFCWNVDKAPQTTSIIGAFQQIDKRFIFDLKRQVLSFAPENCTVDARETN